MRNFTLLIIFLITSSAARAQCVADAGPDRFVCSQGITLQDTVQLGGSPAATGGVPPYTFQWTKPIENNNPWTAAHYYLDYAQLDKPSILYGSSNPVYYLLTVTDANGNTCQDSARVEFSAYLEATAPATFPTINLGDSVFLQGFPHVMGGIGVLEVLWSPNEGLKDSTSHNFWAKPTQSTNYAVRITDSIGCVRQSGTQHVVTVNQVSSISDNFQSTASVDVYPNPTSSVFQVKTSGFDKAESKTFTLFDATGRVVKRQLIQSASQEIGCKELPAGTYIYTLQSPDERFDTGKLVIE